MILFAVLMVSLIFPSQSLVAENFNWQLAGSEKDIRVYTRSIDGSNFKETRGVTHIMTSLASLIAVFDDTKSYTNWLYNCKQAKILKKINIFARITYIVSNAPWPLSDRDFILYSRIFQNKKTRAVRIILTGRPGYLPARPGKVRIKKINGYWLFIPVKDKLIKVVYQLHHNPGGSLLPFLADQNAVKISFYSLLNLKRIVKKIKYQKKRYKYLQ